MQLALWVSRYWRGGGGGEKPRLAPRGGGFLFGIPLGFGGGGAHPVFSLGWETGIVIGGEKQKGGGGVFSPLG
ncbi:hypothetical protein UF06_08140, partial [Vibrio sp. S234-5]